VINPPKPPLDNHKEERLEENLGSLQLKLNIIFLGVKIILVTFPFFLRFRSCSFHNETAGFFTFLDLYFSIYIARSFLI